MQISEKTTKSKRDKSSVGAGSASDLPDFVEDKLQAFNDKIQP